MLSDNLKKILDSPNCHKIMVYYNQDSLLFRKLVAQHGRRLDQIILTNASANHSKFYTDATPDELRLIQQEHNQIGTHGIINISESYDEDY